MLQLLMNTGHLARWDSPPPAERLDALRPFLRAGGGPIPGHEEFVLGGSDLQDGGCTFDVRRGGEIVTLSTLVWDQAIGVAAWPVVRQFCLEQCPPRPGVPRNADPVMPTEVPWLATANLSGFNGLPPEEMAWLAEFQVCFAALMLEEVERCRARQ